jgi:hypothetical protein
LEYREIDPITGCWLWTKARGKKGYGQIWIVDKFIRVSRASYEIFVGPIPEGLIVMHKCDNPPCFNPDHLKAGTQKENIRDAVEKGRWTQGTPWTHCKRGHPRSKRGACPECARAKYEKWYKEKHEEILAQRRLRDRRKVKDGPNPRFSSMVQG